VFGNAGRRTLESVVAVFALLGFCFVPLGSKTAFQHTLALLQTPPAREAGAGFLMALAKARALLVETFLSGPSETAPLPLPSGRSTSEAPVHPVPPRLPRRDADR
jgi:hypothetical protein